MRRLGLLSALVLLWAVAGYAEVQNVTVSGKVEVKGVYRDGYVVQGVMPSSTTGYDENVADANGAGDYFILTSIVKVTADLTDNVSAVVRVIDEREWGGNGTDSLNLSAAYFDLKEFLYAPLSLRAGVWGYALGSELILGDGSLSTNLTYSDLSSKQSFSGVMATYALDNGSVSAAYLKPCKSGVTDDREGDIYVVDANIEIEPAAVELYYVYDGTGVSVNGNNNNDYARNYVGGRITGEIMEGLSGAVEAAYLFGKYGKKDYSAWAMDAGLSYVVDAQRNASVGAAVLYRSGDKDLDNYGNGTNQGDYEAWVAPYEDQVIGEIADYNSNVIALKLSGAVDLIEDVSLSADYYHFWADDDVQYGNGKKDNELGDELDVNLTWNYTSDVQFGLTVAGFWPGKVYEKDDTAVEVLGSVSVAF